MRGFRYQPRLSALSAELPLALVDAGGGVDQVQARGVPRLIASLTPGSAVVSTATETSLLSATFDTAADELAVGDIVRIEAWGTFFNNSGAVRTTTYRVKADTLGLATGIFNLAIAASTNRAWRLDVTMLMQAAGDVSTSGLITCRGTLGSANDESQQTIADGANTVDLAQPITWDLTADHDVSDANLSTVLVGALIWHTKV